MGPAAEKPWADSAAARDPILKKGGGKIHPQLQNKINGDLGQGNPALGLERYKQERNKMIDHRLTNVPHKAGPQRGRQSIWMSRALLAKNSFPFRAATGFLHFAKQC